MASSVELDETNLETVPGLSRLETIISSDMARFMELNQVPPAELLFDFRQAMLEEAERIKNSIMTSVVNVKKKRELSKLIQRHQQIFIQLTSQLLKYTHPEKIVSESGSAETPLLCHYTYRSLEDLLNFVERHFGGYFNKDVWVPASYHLIVAEEIRQDFAILAVRLHISDIQNPLREMILSLFQKFIDEPSSTEVTYRTLRYLKLLKEELFRTTYGAAVETDVNREVDQLLLNLNFNSVLYFNYRTNRIVEEINAIETHGGKQERLALILKQINQLRDKPGIVFDPRYPSIREQMAEWIIEELNFQQKAHQLEIKFAANDSPVPITAKIELDLSVAQVACLVRGLVECDVIQNKNLSEVIRLIAGIAKTKRSESISAESFRMKYYNIEDSTKMAVQKMLKQVADYLLKN